MLFKPYFAPSPYCYRCKSAGNGYSENVSFAEAFKKQCKEKQCGGECIKEVEKILKRRHDKIAAAIIEPMVQGAVGMLVMPSGYMKTFERLCRKYGILLICDEVATGFGRTGKMFACEHEGIKPDLMCLAKGITGGYLPLAVTLATEEIYSAFLGRYEDFKTFFHGHTYTANPLACAAALANLEVFKKEQTIQRIAPVIRTLKEELAKLGDLPWVGEIRQIGLMVAVEIVKDKKTKETYPAKNKIYAKICMACRALGLIIRPLDNNLILMPPLSTTPREAAAIVGIIKKAIFEVLV